MEGACVAIHILYNGITGMLSYSGIPPQTAYEERCIRMTTSQATRQMAGSMSDVVLGLPQGSICSEGDIRHEHVEEGSPVGEVRAQLVRTPGVQLGSPVRHDEKMQLVRERRRSSAKHLTKDSEAPKNSLKKIVLASTIGNILEWYDFGVFAFLAPQIGSQFFPENDKATGIMNAFIVFGGAFVMRPLGAMVFGHIGDRHGRMTALNLSVALMAISTFAIGCLPTYEKLGAMAPLLLTLCRLFQGLSVGGEFVGSFVYAVESAPRGREGLMGSMCTASAVMGTTLGSWTGLILHSALTEEELHAWGWRIPFWSGLLIGLFAVWMRNGLREGETFTKSKEAAGDSHAKSASPVLDGLKSQPLSVVLCFFITSAFGFVGWFISTFAPVLYLDLMDPPLSLGPARRSGAEVVYTGGAGIWLVHTLICTLKVFAIPLWGWAGDQIGNRRAMTMGSSLLVVIALPACIAMGSGDVALSFLGQAMLGVLYSGAAGNLPTYLVGLVPVEVRYSCLSLGYNTALAMFGGTAGIVSTYLYKTYHSTMAIGVYMFTLAFLSCSAVIIQNMRAARRERNEAVDVQFEMEPTV